MAKTGSKPVTILSLALAIGLALPVPGHLARRAHGAEPLVAVNPGSSSPSLTGSAVSQGVRPRVAPRHILVQLHPRASEQQFLHEARAQGLRRLGRIRGTQWLTMALPAGASAAHAAQAARGLSGVLRATLDPIVAINDQIPPRDPLYKNDDDPSTKPCDPTVMICDAYDLVDQWGLFKVGAEAGWQVQRGSAGVVIAILDSGVALDHDDLRAKLWTNPGEIPGNGIDDDGNGIIDDVHGADFVGNNTGAPDDDPTSKDGNPDVPVGGGWEIDPEAFPFGIRFAGDPAVGDAVDNNGDGLIDIGVTHGTLVAGIAAAATDNVNPETSLHEGMAGACWNCRLMPVRMINAEGWAFGSAAAAAIAYAADMGAHVINVSWGIDVSNATPELLESLQILVDAIDYATSRGVIVVAAAGNSGTAGLHFPAIMANTIAVGSSNWVDRRSDFSSFARPLEIPDNGIDDDGNGWVDDVLDVVAPGELIWSTAVVSAYDSLLYELLGLSGIVPGTDTYTASDGTSFATPLVSGYVGLLLSQNPGATLKQIRQTLRTNAVDLLDPNGLGQNLVGYDPYSGFGRLRMVVPAQTPPPNEAPIANAGPDQVLSVKGKATSASVTLDGSGSRDPDGTLVSYQWLENGVPIATGRIVTVSLPLGVHTITLRVTDDDLAPAEDTARIEVARKGTGRK
jgi:subtilisin family serine protease